MQKKIRRRTFLAAGLTAVGMVGAGGGAAEYAYHIEPAWIEVTAQDLSLPHLDFSFDGYRIVQLSDIHADLLWMDYTRLSQIVQLVNEQQPDLIVLTGDFITGSVTPAKFAVLSALRALRARDGVFAVLGNHDHWVWGGPAGLRKLFHKYGIHDLNDRAYSISRLEGTLHLVGLDDLWPDSSYIAPLWSHKPRLTNLLHGLPADGAVILLVHEPDFADVAASTGRIALQLSGHSHGGQVRLPLRGALALPPLGQRYPMGLYQTGNMLHYTNRGVGMVPPRVRFGCRPEISVFTCHPA